MEENKLLHSLQLNKLKDFIKENSDLILSYINTEILKDVGEMNFNYFMKVTEYIFSENINIKILDNNINLLPYFIFTLLEGKGRLDYTSLRVETINFSKINKEASVYYNYAKFSLHNETFIIDLMQTKIGGMPIDDDIIKFSKSIPMLHFGLEEFITKNKK